jgi:hypothetical protein
MNEYYKRFNYKKMVSKYHNEILMMISEYFGTDKCDNSHLVGYADGSY